MTRPEGTQQAKPKAESAWKRELPGSDFSNEPVHAPLASHWQRASQDPTTLTAADVLYLQRAVGNRAVEQLIRRPTPSGDDITQRSVSSEGGTLDNDLSGRIRRIQSGGRSLPATVRTPLETQLNVDLSPVKIHTGSQSVQLNRELGAQAFTNKNHIFYGAGQAPQNLRLTAHEVVHTIQQGAVTSVSRVDRKWSSGIHNRFKFEPAESERAPRMNASANSALQRKPIAKTQPKAVAVSVLPHVRQVKTGIVQLARDPQLIRQDFEDAIGGNGDTLTRLSTLLREAESARSGATRTLFPANTEHGDAYAKLAEDIEIHLVHYVNQKEGGRQGVGAPYVVINAFAMKGRGDLVLARKVAELLQGSITNLQVAFVTNEPQNLTPLARAYADVIFPNNAMLPVHFRNPLLYIHVGGSSGGTHSYEELGIAQSTPMFKLLEYGFSESTAQYNKDGNVGYSLGLGGEDLGVFIDRDAERATQESTPVDQLMNLSDKAALAAIVDKQDPKRGDVVNYLNTTNMYFGYAHNTAPMNQFFDIIMASEIQQGGGNKIDVIMPAAQDRNAAAGHGNTKIDFNTNYLEDELVQQRLTASRAAKAYDEAEDKTQELLTEKYKQRNKATALEKRRALVRDQRRPLLEELGVRRVTLQTRASSRQLYAGAGNREVRILDIFPFSPEDYERILLASGKLTLATGDQSWSQAVSADKNIVYELGSHKTTLFDSWIEVARNTPDIDVEALTAFLGTVREWYNNNVRGVIDGAPQGPEALKNMVAANERITAAFHAVNERIRTVHDAAPRIVGAVKDAIRTKTLAAPQNTAIGRIKSGKHGWFRNQANTVTDLRNTLN